jgi:uncharacterized small protein (DUF1192 family)
VNRTPGHRGPGRRRSWAAVLALLLLLALAGGSRAWAGDEDASIEDLERAVAALQQEVDELRSAGGSAASVQELERRIDLLAAEIEKLRTGSAVGGEETLTGEKGLAPAASRIYRQERGVSIGGYGEALYSNFAARRQDDAESGLTDQIDFVRQILYVGYKFSDTILFNSEIEFEHASTEEGGAVSVEFAYLELQKGKEIGLRAGMLLLPLGFLNELHEPPIFHGARRPEVEAAIIPSTWRENGLGLFGEAGPFEWRAYAVAGLASTGFSAAGIRGGRQSGAESLAEDLALTGRLDLVGVPGLVVGGSFFTGESGQGASVDDIPIGARVSLFDLHGQYRYRGLEVRALWAHSTLGDAELVNRQNGLVGTDSVGTSQGGWYVEAAFDVLSLGPPGRRSLTPFVRYEKLDTQRAVPAGGEKDPARDRSLFTGGFEIRPLPQVVFKLDYQVVRNAARTGANRFNVALGYLF